MPDDGLLTIGFLLNSGNVIHALDLCNTELLLDTVKDSFLLVIPSDSRIVIIEGKVFT